MDAREIGKKAAFAVATVAVVPQLFSFLVRSWIFGRDRALEGSSQLLALVPGITGQYLRRAFLARVLDSFHPSATVEFGTIFSKVGARVAADAYVGPHCHLGLVQIDDGALLGAGVHVPSGPQTHGTTDPNRAIREQAGEARRVHIGAGTWIGSAVVVMADVGRDSVIGAGAVVTRAIPDRVVAAGVPARVLARRETDAMRGAAGAP